MRPQCDPEPLSRKACLEEVALRIYTYFFVSTRGPLLAPRIRARAYAQATGRRERRTADGTGAFFIRGIFEPSGHPAGSLINDHERATATGRVARAPIKQIRIAESIRVA